MAEITPALVSLVILLYIIYVSDASIDVLDNHLAEEVETSSTAAPKSRAIHDFYTHTSAYKTLDSKDTKCYLERMHQKIDASPKKDTHRVLFTTHKLLTKQEVWVLGGPRIAEFCRATPTFLLQHRNAYWQCEDGVIAYKTLEDAKCFIVHIPIGNVFNPLNNTNFIVSSSIKLSKQSLWDLGGSKIVEFCNGFTSYALEPDADDSQLNVINDIPITSNKLRRVVRNADYKLKSQTQSQYLNIGGSSQEPGKAEAEATRDGTKAVVIGSSGMGQAQSQSSPWSCENCYGYPQRPGRLQDVGGYGIPGQNGRLTSDGTQSGTLGAPGSQQTGRPGIVGGKLGDASVGQPGQPGTFDRPSQPGFGDGIPQAGPPGTYYGPGVVAPETPGSQIPGTYGRPGSIQVGQPGQSSTTGPSGRTGQPGFGDGIEQQGAPGTYYGPGVVVPETPRSQIPGTYGRPGSMQVGQSGQAGATGASGRPGQIGFGDGIGQQGAPGTYYGPGSVAPGIPSTYPGAPGSQIPGLYGGPGSTQVGQPGTQQTFHAIPGYPGSYGIPGTGQIGQPGVPGGRQPSLIPSSKIPDGHVGVPGVYYQPSSIPSQYDSRGTPVGLLPARTTISGYDHEGDFTGKVSGDYHTNGQRGQFAGVISGQYSDRGRTTASGSTETGLSGTGPTGTIGYPATGERHPGEMRPGEGHWPGEYRPGTVGTYIPGQGAISLGPSGSYIPGITGVRPAEYMPGQGPIRGGSVPGQVTTAGRPGELIPGPVTTVGRPGDHIPGQVTTGGRPGEYIPGQVTTGERPGYYIPGQVTTAGRPGELIPGQVITGGRPGDYIPGQVTTAGRPGELIRGQVTTGGIPGEYIPGQVTTGGRPGEYIPGQVTTGGRPGEYIPGQDTTGGRPGELIPGQVTTGGRPEYYIPGEVTTGGRPGEYIPGQITTGGRPGELIPGQVTTGGRPGYYIPGEVTTGGRPGEYIPGQITTGGRPGELIPGQITSVVRPGEYIPGQVTTGGRPAEYIPGQVTTGARPGEHIPGQVTTGGRPGEYIPGQLTTGGRPGEYIPDQSTTGGRPGEYIPGQVAIGGRPGEYIPGQVTTGARPGEHITGQVTTGGRPGEYIPGQFTTGGRPGEYIPGQVTTGYISGATRPDDDSDSQVQTSVQQLNNETQASASSQGKYLGGTAQSQVSGTYSGSGSFSASAGTIDQYRGAQTQVAGGAEGAMSSAQGRGGPGQSQAQVQLSSKTGDTTSSAQSGGINHGTNTQVQAGGKGGMADAQANGKGSTSSQANIGFQPYNAQERGEDNGNGNPFGGGGTASAQSGSNIGQSQAQLNGKYRFGIKYTGSAQASSSNDGKNLPLRNISTNQIQDFKLFDFNKPTFPTISTTQAPVSVTTIQVPTSSHNKRSGSATLDYSEEEDIADEEYEEEYIETESKKKVIIPINSQHTRAQRQYVALGKLEDLDATVIQATHEDNVYEPGQMVPGTEFAVPSGLRGRVVSTSGQDTYAQGSNSQAQTVHLNPGTGRVTYIKPPIYAVTSNTHLRNGQGYGSGYTYQPQQYQQLRNGESYPRFVSSTRSETGSKNIITGKKTPSVYYSQSSTCGYFTNSCVFSNGKKVCIPKPKLNPDGTPMIC